MTKRLIITGLALVGGFIVMEIVAPNHWTLFSTYVGGTWTAFRRRWFGV